MKRLEDKESITKEEFIKYYKMKESGVIPLYEIRNIAQATGLLGNTISIIGDNYTYLYNKFIGDN